MMDNNIEFDAKASLEEKRKSIKTFDDLIVFLRDVDNYNTGYGTAPMAIAQAALAVAWYFSSRFGITGFQAGFTMWDFITGWSKPSNKTGLRLVDYDDMLYPQYGFKFDKTIRKDTWKLIQEQAKNNLEEDSGFADTSVVNHWRSIVSGRVPFGYTIED